MVLYRTTLVLLEEELIYADPTFLSPFYDDNVVFDASVRRSTAQLQQLMDWELDQGYFPDPAKSLFIANNPEDEEAARREF